MTLDQQQLPTHPSQITAGFLTSILGVTITRVEAEELPAGAGFNAQLARLRLRYDQPETGVLRSLIAKLPTIDPELHHNAAVFQPGNKESWYYRHGATRTPVNVPVCYFNAVDPKTGESFLLLEDLSAARSGNRIDGISVEDARLALQAAAALHAAWWAVDPASEPELARLMGNAQAEQNLVEQLYLKAWPKFLEYSPFQIPDDFRALGERLVGHIAEAEALLDNSPRTLIHGDFRIENLFFGTQEGKPTCWVIDWEDVLLWNGMFDVAWLLGGCLPVAVCDQEEALLSCYHQALCAAGVKGYSLAQCQYDYRCAMLSSVVQGILTVAALDPVDEYNRRLSDALTERLVMANRRLGLSELLGG